MVLTLSASGAASVRGVAVCGSWVCPHCVARVGEARAEQVRDVATAWLAASRTHRIVFVTLTIRHEYADGLGKLLSGAAAAWSNGMCSGKGWATTRARFGIVGWFKAWEVTTSLGSASGGGWHPHIHAALFLEYPTDLDALAEHFYARWADAVTKHLGPAHRPDRAHGINVQAAHDVSGLANYLGKVEGLDQVERDAARELTRPDAKQARRRGRFTPWDLLDVWADRQQNGTRRAAARERFYEFARATYGVHRFRWSRGFLASLHIADPTDEELAARADAAEVVAAVEVPVSPASLAALPDLLDMLETDGVDALLSLLARRGIPGHALPVSAVAVLNRGPGP